ncbi:MAG: TetR/AcrR family transcriptional regulator [Micrococcales bacterium]|nr:TetR/AcrR family transcriptional regulator [Micrococcales bacterium]
MASQKRDREDLGSAAQALAAAVSALTRAVGQGVAEVKDEVSKELSEALREASDELADASVTLGLGKRTVTFTGPKRSARSGASDRRRSQAEKTRARLIEAASTVIAEKGYEGASVGDVAAEAGYTKGAVYAHFRNKEDLLLAIVEDLTAEEGDRIAADPETPLRQLFCDLDDDPEALRRTLLTLEIYTYAIRHPAAQPRLGSAVASTWEQAAALLAAERTGGRPSTAPSQEDRDTALAVLAVHTFAQVFSQVVGDDEARDAGARIIDRLLPPDGRTASP